MLDNTQPILQSGMMNFDRYAGLASAVGAVLFVAILAWLGIAGPIWRAYWTASPEQWLGFAGSVFGGVITLVAAIVAWFAVQSQIREQRLATEKHRRDAANAVLTKHAAAIFSISNVHGRVVNASPDMIEKRYNEFEAFRTTAEFFTSIADPLLGRDNEAVMFFASLLRNDAAVRAGKHSTEQAKNYALVIGVLYKDLLEMIRDRRIVMLNGSVDDLTSLHLIRLGPFRRAIREGGAVVDLGVDED